MKKFLIILLAMLALTSCGDNKTSTESSEDISGTKQEILQPDPISTITTEVSQEKSEKPTGTTQKTTTPVTTDSITAEINETTTALTEIPETSAETTTVTSETVPEDVQPDPLGAGAFEYDKDGAVQFTEDEQSEDEQTLISAGQALFESACQTEWKFTVGCPYQLDTGFVAKNELGWVFYKITDENIHSLADVENDYYNIFSDRYPHEDIKTLYIERDGSVYALNGQREMNAYYSMSRITGIESRTDDEIFFTVENQFEGTDQNPDTPYSETETFSAVISPDGKWKAGKFRLPY